VKTSLQSPATPFLKKEAESSSPCLRLEARSKLLDRRQRSITRSSLSAPRNSRIPPKTEGVSTRKSSYRISRYLSP
jgi:hypothetical protein